jgi:hypothetical protein
MRRIKIQEIGDIEGKESESSKNEAKKKQNVREACRKLKRKA